jgi:hypothetical protein
MILTWILHYPAFLSPQRFTTLARSSNPGRRAEQAGAGTPAASSRFDNAGKTQWKFSAPLSFFIWNKTRSIELSTVNAAKTPEAR